MREDHVRLHLLLLVFKTIRRPFDAQRPLTMPPLRAGLVKRRPQKPPQAYGTPAVDASYVGGALHDSDSDSGLSFHDSDSDDSVLFGEGKSDQELSDKEDGDQSSDLTDSEGDDDDNDDDDDEEEDSKDEKEENETTEDDEKEESDTEKTIEKNTSSKQKTLTAAGHLQRDIDEDAEAVGKHDEYASGDSSDEEGRINPRGAVPAHWYDEYPHVGYDLDGRRIMKPPQRDAIDAFLQRCEDPDFWRTVRDPSTGQDVVLSRADLELLGRLRAGAPPNPDHNEYEPWREWFSREVLATPVRAFPEHKRSFLPSQSDKKQISKLVHALKMGWIKSRQQEAAERRKRRERQFYNLWGQAADEEARGRGIHRHIPAPRRPLPTHAESYNPPPEYLLDDKEMKEWRKLEATPWKRKYTFLPTKHASLRTVPAYPRYTRERFLRCLDLYLAPRALKMRLTIQPQDLLPQLPSPRDLQPFPTHEVLVLRGHTAGVRSVDVEPAGQYVVSGADDGAVRVWELATGRCVRTLTTGEAVRCVAWTPAAGLTLVAVCTGKRVLLWNPGAGVGAHRAAARTDALLETPPPNVVDAAVDARTAAAASWTEVDADEWARGVRIAVTHFKDAVQVAWHARGDYLCATLTEAASRAVVVHQLSRRRSQLPFTKCAGLVQSAIFHPTRPLLFVATQRNVRVYDLVKQELVRKLLTGMQWISAIALHPGGDNLLVASYDRKLAWFDLDLAATPYRTLRLHGSAVRAVAFHKRYPLFASAGDDLKVVVSHGTVYADLLQSPLLVPLKQLWGHERRDELGVLSLVFHPTQPWLLSAGADATIRLYV